MSKAMDSDELRRLVREALSDALGPADAMGSSDEGQQPVAVTIENDADLFIWDCDGMGVSLKRQVYEAFDGKKIDFRMYNGSNSPEWPTDIYEPVKGEDQTFDPRKARTNEETFKNKRAQFCWILRDKFYRTYRAVQHGEYNDPDELISISSGIENIEKLRSETCRIPRKHNGAGFIQIMGKPEMQSKFGIKSPNMFDALVMSQEVPDVADIIVSVMPPDVKWLRA